jgi:hypothetical protein
LDQFGYEWLDEKNTGHFYDSPIQAGIINKISNNRANSNSHALATNSGCYHIFVKTLCDATLTVIVTPSEVFLNMVHIKSATAKGLYLMGRQWTSNA